MAREANDSSYPNLIFRETFNDEQTTLKNGGVPTDVTFSEGKGDFNGTSSKINYNLGLNGTYSIRIRCNPTSFAAVRYLFDSRGSNVDGTGLIYLNGTTGLIVKSSGTAYVNGTATTTTVAGNNNEIVITGITLTEGTGTNLSAIGASSDNRLELLGTMDLVEIYAGTLTASEVSNLYSDSWNTEQSFGGEPKVNGIPATSSTFDDDSWWQKTDDVTISGGTGNLVNADSGYGFYKTGYSTIGKKYRITYSITSYTDGDIRTQMGTGGIGINRSAVGTYTEDITASGNTQLYFVSQTENTNLSIDNVSVQELNPKTLIDFDSTNGALELGDLNDTSTATAVSVVKNGTNYAAEFNGTTSLIDTGTDMISDKAVTVMGWIKPYSWGETSGRIINNDKCIFRVSSVNNNIRFTSDNSGRIESATNSILFNKWQFVAVTRESDGTANFYIGDKDTAPAISGTPDTDSGTPSAGTTNVIIGNNAAATRTFDGLIPKLKVVEGILTLAQITQVWSETLKEIK